MLKQWLTIFLDILFYVRNCYKKLIKPVRAYQLGSVTLVVPLLTLIAILNTIYEYFMNHNKNKFIQNNSFYFDYY